MKKALKAGLITLLILSAITAGVLYWLTTQKKGENQDNQKILEEESGESEKRAFIFSTPNDAISLVVEGAGQNVLSFPTANPFDVANSENARARLDRLAQRTGPSFEEPLIAYNPFGTNPNTFYFYFETNRRVAVKYTITVEDETVPDFVRTVYSGGDNNVSKKHEFTMGGLVPGMVNYMILSLCTEEGEVLSSRTYSFQAEPALPGVPTRVSMEKGRVSEESSSNGLYHLFPEGVNAVLSYDNSGVLRGQTLLKESAGKRMLFENNHIFYADGKKELLSVSPVGQVMGVFPLEAYGNILDFDYDGYGNLYALMKKKKNYTVVRVDLATGQSSQVLKLAKKVVPTGISLAEDGSAYISSEKPAGMMVASNLASNYAKVTGIIGKKSAWASTSYKKKMYQKQGEGKATNAISVAFYQDGKGSLSFLAPDGGYYEYQPNNQNRTFSVNHPFNVSLSGNPGSGQSYKEHYVASDGNSGVYCEYDKQGELIKQFASGLKLRSVIKMNLKQTCFN